MIKQPSKGLMMNLESDPIGMAACKKPFLRKHFRFVTSVIHLHPNGIHKQVICVAFLGPPTDSHVTRKNPSNTELFP